MAKRDLEDEISETAEEAAPPKVIVDNGRYPGDLVKDKKSGRKGKFLNEYGTNGRAVIVMPDGMTRSELWDATQIEILKRVKRPAPGAGLTMASTVSKDLDDDEIEEEEPGEET